MSGTAEKLRQELQAAQRTIASLQGQIKKRESTYRLTTLDLEENRSALRFMLEDLKAGRKKIERAHHEWITALDAVNDPIFLHDKEFRILRCNKAYQQCAGVPFHEIIGQPYYEIFPKIGAPLPCCLRALEKAEEEEVIVGGAIYRSRAYSIHDEQGTYLYSVHTLEDITEKQRAETERQRLSEAIRQAAEAIVMVDADACISYINPAFARLFGYAPDEIIGQSTAILSAPAADTLQPDAAFRSVREQGCFQGEALRRAKDGAILPVYINVAALHSSEGKFEGFVAAITDLRPLKKAQQALVESEEKSRIIFEGVLDGILLADAETKRFAGGNSAIYHMLGYSSEEIMQLGVADIHPQQALPHVEEQFEKQLHGEIQLAADIPVKRKDGSIFYADIKSSPVSFGGRGYLLGIFRDITERKQAEQEIKDLSARLQHILASTPAVHYACRIDGGHFVPTYASPNLKDLWGYGQEEYLGNAEWWWSGIHPGGRDSVAGAFRAAVMATSRSHYAHEYRFRRKDGTYRWVHDELQIIRDQAGQPLEIVGSWLDITEHKQAEDAFRLMVASLAQNIGAEFFHEAVRSLSAWLGAECVIIGETMDGDRVKSLAMQLDGKAIEHYEYALSGTPCNNLAHKGYCEYPEGVCQLFPGDKDLIDMGAEAYVGTPVRNRNGESVGILCAILRRKLSLPAKAKEVMEMIAVRAGMEIERKKAEETLKRSEALLSEMGRMAKIGGWEFDTRTGQGTWTEEVARIHDMEPEEQTSLEIGLGFYQDESRQKIEAAASEAITNGTPYDLELEMVTAKGNHKWVRTIAQPVKEGGKVVRVGGSFQDITERRQAEIAIQHANRALATLSAVNSDLVHITDEDELLQAVCNAIVEQRGYRMAWVGYKQHDEHKSIRIMARAGHDEGYLDAARISWAESEHGMGPSGCAMRSGATQLCQDMANDPLFLPWRDAALKRGYAASITLPLLNGDNTVFGILNVYAAETNAFTPNEIALLEEMADDLAFGVRSLHIRLERDLALEQNQQHLEKLRNSLEDTVRAIASIAEMRDPYTAGHQARVADLAAAIARQMGLPEEQAHAVHLAGTVHDLGKIKIPAEILSKPGKITDLEFGLIKIHPQAGYDILKGIDFPWPIAQMVLQHHERMDGSGYPQGLKGEDILLEARILAVADVVEAISAHRPYRAGLGNDVAMEEITKNRGKFYDPQAVDACLTLFREQGYSFK